MGENHLHYHELIKIMREAVPEAAEVLDRHAKVELDIEKQRESARDVREKLTYELLNKHYAAIRPLLRPCHQKRFDDLSQRRVRVEGSSSRFNLGL